MSAFNRTTTIRMTVLALAAPLSALPYVDQIAAITQAEAATASKLGDLSRFRTIVIDTQGLVERATCLARRRGSRISKHLGTRPRQA
jgi:hypothetical protein